MSFSLLQCCRWPSPALFLNFFWGRKTGKSFTALAVPPCCDTELKKQLALIKEIFFSLLLLQDSFVLALSAFDPLPPVHLDPHQGLGDLAMQELGGVLFLSGKL